jgi:tRNA (cytidine/uridine-2'-O-)-methyltransferase
VFRAAFLQNLDADGLRPSVASTRDKSQILCKNRLMRLALFQPDIPQNVGAAIRVAACFAAGLDIIEPCGFPLDSRAVRRVAMDYGALAPPRPHQSWKTFLKDGAGGARLVLLTTKADRPVWDFQFRRDDVLLLGRESAGAPPEVHAAAAMRLRIPLAPQARSLNVAAAAAVALAEARRQLGWDQP